jgi:hypothetical protein
MLRRDPVLTRVLLTLVALFVLFEGFVAVRFYLDVKAGRDMLNRLEARIDINDLNMTEDEAAATRRDFEDAGRRFESARRYTDRDVVFNIAKAMPGLGRQVKAVDVLVDLGARSSAVGADAGDVLLAYARFQPAEGRTALQSGLDFLESQRVPMSEVDTGLEALLEKRRDVPDGLVGPLGSAVERFDAAAAKLENLVTGYEKAYATLPGLLGMEGRKTYLVLPQNDAEIFPSGGLISSYGIASFSDAHLEGIDLEYFGTLFDRWQSESGGEYIEPPGPLKNYLKRGYSWGLGEAGWYPDFPTTARLARMFVEKGGAPPTDGVIALDQQFVRGLLNITGPIEVPDYGVTITAENLVEKTLELTRDDAYAPGGGANAPRKAFLSYLSRHLLDRVFATPKEDWVAMLNLFDRMARERHLQLYFEDTELQGLISDYGFDGGIERTDGDYLMLVDTSVNSTKLNIALQYETAIDVQLNGDGTATTAVTYTIKNPYDVWKQGRDPQLMAKLMLDGVYGSYARVYVPRGSRVLDVKLDGQSAGPEQANAELGKQVFGRFFPVLPGETRSVTFSFRTPVVFEVEGRTSSYRLYIQKEAGMPAIPLTVRLRLPDGSRLLGATLDGRELGNAESIATHLATDRVLEVRFTAPKERGGG